MKNFLILAVAFLALVILPAGTAHALELADAKAQGLVGERPDGLLGIVNPPGRADVQALVKDVNAGRVKIYTNMSLKQKLPMQQIQAIWGEKLILETTAGNYVLRAGTWVQK